MLAIAGCSPAAGPAELAPVFVVLCADPDPEQDPHPCCTGFALGSQVVTANHCAPDDRVQLVSRRQWLTTASAYSVGTVTRRDEARDIAWLDAPTDGPGLELGGSFLPGDSVSALTPVGAKAGIVGGQAGLFWQSTMPVAFGDSGAAVVDASGRAVGVVHACLSADGKACDPMTGIFAGLP